MRLKVGNMRLISNWRSWVLGPDTISFNQNSYEASAWLGFTSVGPGAEHWRFYFCDLYARQNMRFFTCTRVGCHSPRQSGSTRLFHCKKAATIYPFNALFEPQISNSCNMNWPSFYLSYSNCTERRKTPVKLTDVPSYNLESPCPTTTTLVGHNTPVSPSDKWQSWLGGELWRTPSHKTELEKRERITSHREKSMEPTVGLARHVSNVSP